MNSWWKASLINGRHVLHPMVQPARNSSSSHTHRLVSRRTAHRSSNRGAAEFGGADPQGCASCGTSPRPSTTVTNDDGKQYFRAATIVAPHATSLLARQF